LKTGLQHIWQVGGGKQAFATYAGDGAIVARSSNGPAGVWSERTCQRIGEWNVDLKRIDAFVPLPGTSRVLCAGNTESGLSMSLVDVVSGIILWSAELPASEETKPYPAHLAVAEDGDSAAVACGCRLWTIETARGTTLVEGCLVGHRIAALAWNAVTGQILTAGNDGTICSWDAATLLAIDQAAPPEVCLRAFAVGAGS
jgi:hypothetical protein